MASSSPFQIQQARPPPVSLCSEPGAFCFYQKDFSKLLSSDADWLTCNLLFLGNAPTLSGSRHSQLPAPNGDLAVTFSWASQDPREAVLKKRLRYLGIASAWIVRLCPIKSILVSSWQFPGDSLSEGVSDSQSCFKILMIISLIPVLWLLLQQWNQMDVLNHSWILNWSFMAGVVATGPAACELQEQLCWLVLVPASRWFKFWRCTFHHFNGNKPPKYRNQNSLCLIYLIDSAKPKLPCIEELGMDVFSCALCYQRL